MRIDIITLHAVQNYGSVLQAFATQEFFRKHGCEARIINYVRENVRYENLLKTWGKGNPVRAAVMIPTIIRWKKVFEGFTHEYLNLSGDILTYPADFRNYNTDADAYCTGSDQVWNSEWNRKIIPCLYLDFIPSSCYKFSFSASFGKERLSGKEISRTKGYLKEYNRISVRENSAKDIIEKQYKLPEAVRLIDPTLCMNAEFWRHHASERKIKQDYILIYNLNRSKGFDEYAKELSGRTGLRLVRLCTRYDQFWRAGKSVLVPEISDFISLIDNAEYVLTDSFHATAFSMNMGTEPICVYPDKFGGRIKSFLEMTDSLQCHIADYNDFDVVNRHVDFEKVNKILRFERKKADMFIESVISDISAHKKQEIDS